MSSLISFHCYIFTSFLSSQPGPHFLLCLLYHYPSQSLSSVSFPFCNSYFFPTSCSSSCFPLTFFPFLSILISHSQVLPDSFTHSFLFSFHIASFPFQLPYFFTLLVILTFLFSSSWIAFPCVSYLLTHFLTSSSLFVILYFVSFFVFLSLHFLLRLWTQNSYWKGFVFFQLLIKRRFNTIKCHLLPVGTQQ